MNDDDVHAGDVVQNPVGFAPPEPSQTELRPLPRLLPPGSLRARASLSAPRRWGRGRWCAAATSLRVARCSPAGGRRRSSMGTGSSSATRDATNRLEDNPALAPIDQGAPDNRRRGQSSVACSLSLAVARACHRRVSEASIPNGGDGVPESRARSNYEAYKARHREALEREHTGRVALMHDAEVVAIYNDEQDAYQIGVEKYGLGNFSLQVIGAEPISLGFVGALL